MKYEYKIRRRILSLNLLGEEETSVENNEITLLHLIGLILKYDQDPQANCSININNFRINLVVKSNRLHYLLSFKKNSIIKKEIDDLKFLKDGNEFIEVIKELFEQINTYRNDNNKLILLHGIPKNLITDFNKNKIYFKFSQL